MVNANNNESNDIFCSVSYSWFKSLSCEIILCILCIIPSSHGANSYIRGVIVVYRIISSLRELGGSFDQNLKVDNSIIVEWL